MAIITINRTYEKDGVLTDPDSVKLSDPTGTWGVKRNDTNDAVVADGEEFTKVSTGVYRHTFIEPGTDLTYTIYEEVIAQSGDEADYFQEIRAGIASAAAANTWTITGLANEILGSLNQARNASGGTVPDRLLNTVKQAYEELWEMWEWKYRRTRTTFTTSSGTDTVDLPTDFEKLDQKWMQETSNNGSLRFTDDIQLFEDLVHVWGSQGGRPAVALIRPKTSDSGSYLWEVFLAPTPDGSLTYPYFYLRMAPSLGNSAVPLWPRPFNRGWFFLAMARAKKKFMPGKDWQQDEALWQAWVENAKTNNDEVLASNTPQIRDGYGDLRLTTSRAGFGYGESIQG